MLPLKLILCPIDFSEPSLAALDIAAEFAQQFNAELRVFHVLAYTVPLPPDMMMGTDVEMYATDQERCDDALIKVQEVIKTRLPSTVNARGETRVGCDADDIVATAEADNADMIVMGTHGLTGWRHLAFGSVAEKVVQTAHCPVLTVHCRPCATP